MTRLSLLKEDISVQFPFLHLVQVSLLVPKLMAIHSEGCIASQALSTMRDVELTQMEIIPLRCNRLDCPSHGRVASRWVEPVREFSTLGYPLMS